jgi:hypothetical protein
MWLPLTIHITKGSMDGCLLVARMDSHILTMVRAQCLRSSLLSENTLEINRTPIKKVLRQRLHSLRVLKVT